MNGLTVNLHLLMVRNAAGRSQRSASSRSADL